jgi:large subunit ribosomal protein L9
MQVILMERIENLDALGDIVDVKSGFARNFLVPQQKAKTATKSNIAEFETLRSDLEKKAADVTKAAEDRLVAINGVGDLEIEVRAGVGGKLFGSVSNNEIAELITAKGVAVERREVRMPDGAIRNIGEYEILIHLHGGVEATVKVNVVADADSDMEEVQKQVIGTFTDDIMPLN